MVRNHKSDDDWVAHLVVVIAKKGISDSQRIGFLDGSERQNRLVRRESKYDSMDCRNSVAGCGICFGS